MATKLEYPPTWFTEPEAAEYCRCSFRAFREMRLPAYNSGGRKVYNRDALDLAIRSRPWDQPRPAPRNIIPGKASAMTPDLARRLQAVRLRPYKPRKKISE
jgi:hypothetical protein